MVDIQSIIKEVKVLYEKAIKADKCEDHENAFTYYSKAAEQLNYIRKNVKNYIIKKYIQKK